MKLKDVLKVADTDCLIQIIVKDSEGFCDLGNSVDSLDENYKKLVEKYFDYFVDTITSYNYSDDDDEYDDYDYGIISIIICEMEDL